MVRQVQILDSVEVWHSRLAKVLLVLLQQEQEVQVSYLQQLRPKTLSLYFVGSGFERCILVLILTGSMESECVPYLPYVAE